MRFLRMSRPGLVFWALALAVLIMALRPGSAVGEISPSIFCSAIQPAWQPNVRQAPLALLARYAGPLQAAWSERLGGAARIERSDATEAKQLGLRAQGAQHQEGHGDQDDRSAENLLDAHCSRVV